MITAWRSPVRPRGGSPSGRGPGRARRLLGIGLVAALLGLAGVSCDRLPTDRPSTDADGALTSESDWGLALAQTVSLDPAGGPVLTEIHEWASGPDGRLAAVDRSDGRVHVFSSDGRLEFVLGADGDLGEPMDAAFTPDGRIVVATLRRPHVHVFEANGTPSHSFDLPDVLFALKVASLGDGRLVVLNHRRDPVKERLGLYDLQGNLIRRFHPSRAAYYNVPYWESTTRRLLATTGERIVAGGNLLYPFERYDAEGNRRGSVGTPPARWEGPPEPPEGAFTGPDARKEFEEWRRTFTTVSALAFTGDSTLAVVTERLDPDVLSHDEGSYTLDLFHGGDPVLRGHDLPGRLLEGGDRLWVLEGLDPDTDTWTVLAYRVTGPGGT